MKLTVNVSRDLMTCVVITSAVNFYLRSSLTAGGGGLLILRGEAPVSL